MTPLQATAAAESPEGLSSIEATRRLIDVGPNEIRREEASSLLALVGRQFASPVIWLLIAASVISVALDELLDAAAIGVLQRPPRHRPRRAGRDRRRRTPLTIGCSCQERMIGRYNPCRDRPPTDPR